MAKHTISTNVVSDLLFVADTLPNAEGSFETITMSFSEIGTRFPEDDVFYYVWERVGEPVACVLSTLKIAVADDPIRDAASRMLKTLQALEAHWQATDEPPSIDLKESVEGLLTELTGQPG